MICFAFPLEHEAAPLLQACTQRETFLLGPVHCTVANLRDRRVLVAIVGMGEKAARAAAEILLDHFAPSAFVLAGYGGALVPPLQIGQVLVSTNYSSPDVVSFLRGLSGFDFATFCTAGELAGTPAERDRHAHAARAEVIEMETAAVAFLLESRGVPFVAVRAISDDYPTVLPVGALAAGFDAARGKPTPLRLLLRLATHPLEVRPFARFVGHLSVARTQLTAFLTQLNDELPNVI